MTGPSRSGRVGHDRWLVSYADFVTLLLAFFVTLYGAAAVDADRLAAETPSPSSPALPMAFDGVVGAPPTVGGRPTLVTIPAVVARSGSLDGVQVRVSAALAEAIRGGRIEVVQDARGLVLSLPEGATFESASADVTPTAQALIGDVARELAPLPHALRIEGHTDDVPVTAGRYRSNWELSTARAGAVVAFLIARAGLAPERLSAAGYAEFHPRVPNDSTDHRARNRRVDIVVIAQAEP